MRYTSPESRSMNASSSSRVAKPRPAPFCRDVLDPYAIDRVDHQHADRMTTVAAACADVWLLPPSERQTDRSVDEPRVEWLLEEEHASGIVLPCCASRSHSMSSRSSPVVRPKSRWSTPVSGRSARVHRVAHVRSRPRVHRHQRLRRRDRQLRETLQLRRRLRTQRSLQDGRGRAGAGVSREGLRAVQHEPHETCRLVILASLSIAACSGEAPDDPDPIRTDTGASSDDAAETSGEDSALADTGTDAPVDTAPEVSKLECTGTDPEPNDTR